MKLTFAAAAAVLICLASLAARSVAVRAAAQAAPDRAYADGLRPAPGLATLASTSQERLALAAIDGHLRGKLQRLSKR